MGTFFEKYGSDSGGKKQRTMSSSEVEFWQFLADNVDALAANDAAEREKMNKWEQPNYPPSPEAHRELWERRVANSYMDWQFEKFLIELKKELKNL